MRLNNKRAIITAAASGMGKAGCELFTKHGARVAAIDRDEVALADVVKSINDGGGQARGFVADLSDTKATIIAIQEASAWLGGVDILWSHAGMPAPGDVESLDIAQYQLSADVNLTASILVSGEVLKVMRGKNSGSIIFTSSTSGLVGSALSPLYSALKSGVIGLTKGLAVRYVDQGIRVNALCPGPVSTPMLHNDFLNVDARFTKEQNLARVVSVVPMGRAADPAEVAHAALWLASDDSSYVTGVALPVDGGMTAR